MILVPTNFITKENALVVYFIVTGEDFKWYDFAVYRLTNNKYKLFHTHQKKQISLRYLKTSLLLQEITIIKLLTDVNSIAAYIVKNPKIIVESKYV